MISAGNISLILYIFLLTATLSSCGKAPLPVETQPSNPCVSEEIDEFITIMDSTAKRFEAVVLLAENTSSENLEPIIKEMQAIGTELDIISTPSCTLKAKAAFDDYISSEIQCYFYIYAASLAGEASPPEQKTDSCNLALGQLEYYYTQMDILREE